MCACLRAVRCWQQFSPALTACGMCMCTSMCFSNGMPPAPVSCMCRVAADVHYGFVFKVTAKDTYEGLQAASDLFVAGTLEK